MTALILDGRTVAKAIKEKLAIEIQEKQKKGLNQPGLAVILVGNHSASQVYVQNKRLACQEVGIKSYAYDLPENTSETDLVELIEQLNHKPEIHGILVQLPLPPQIHTGTIIAKMNFKKDVDGFHPYNVGLLAEQTPLLHPCTPLGIMTLLNHYQIQTKGLHAVIVGASNIVGRPMALELLNAEATITVCHIYTKNLKQHVMQADLLIVAIGKKDIIKSEWIKEGAIVVDVGIHRLANGSLSGDIDFISAKERASWITPVPGGVGPMTVATLLQNTVRAAELQHHVKC